MQARVRASTRSRDMAASLLALGSGAAIAWLDSRPTWDDAGVTAAVLLMASAGAAAVSGRRPWLWALLVGLPTPLVEMASGGNIGSLAAVAFAGVGSAVGYLIARAARPTTAA